jgi:hypothetical protein
VHRCEALVDTRITGKHIFPRHIITWFDLAKNEQLDMIDYDYIDGNVEFGTIYLNYVEIGKSLEHLATDFDDISVRKRLNLLGIIALTLLLNSMIYQKSLLMKEQI